MTKKSLPRSIRVDVGYMARFSNVVHMQYHRRLYDQVVAVDKEKLKLTDAVLAEWREAIDQEVELNKEATQSVHTARLVKLDAERDRLLTNFFGVIRIQKLSPVAAVQEAAQRAEVIFKPYAGIQNEALEAESGHIAGMFEDAKKCTADLTTLGLTAVLSQLRTVNAEFEQLGATRRHEAVEAKRPSATAIRPKTDEALEFVVQHIQGSYLFSTVEADRLLIYSLAAEMNKITADFKASHKSSDAQKKKHPGDGKKPGGNPGGGNPGGGKKPDDGGKNPGGNPGGGGKTPDPGKDPGKDPEKEKELDEIEKMLTPLIPAFEKEIGDRPGSLSFAREVVGTGKDRRFKFYNSRTKVWTWATLRADGTLAPWGG
ncbi:hypothetical protein J5A66_04730 [Prevotella sp. oral taxon 475]|uniref:DUF6261 family protein n=1 Tax=Prevotella sp. oral taxon 475 TaxID=712471 RepID=UPI001BADF638|nr:DUF6261 family protein [Prevotella sp. oral taxon 475]QUB48080.1 hypothetical protein J5A66_04730 [Prevotella sp. oral taxon 475]